jgi:hypothetical protein
MLPQRKHPFSSLRYTYAENKSQAQLSSNYTQKPLKRCMPPTSWPCIRSMRHRQLASLYRYSYTHNKRSRANELNVSATNIGTGWPQSWAKRFCIRTSIDYDTYCPVARCESSWPRLRAQQGSNRQRNQETTVVVPCQTRLE